MDTGYSEACNTETEKKNGSVNVLTLSTKEGGRGEEGDRQTESE